MELLKEVRIESDASVIVVTDTGVYNYRCTPGHPYIDRQPSESDIRKCYGARIIRIDCERDMLQILTDKGAITIFAADSRHDDITWDGGDFPQITLK